jgi:hypothetical protein
MASVGWQKMTSGPIIQFTSPYTTSLGDALSHFLFCTEIKGALFLAQNKVSCSLAVESGGEFTCFTRAPKPPPESQVNRGDSSLWDHNTSLEQTGLGTTVVVACARRQKPPTTITSP